MSHLNSKYLAFIKSPQWKAKCELYWQTFGRSCKACGARQGLHVHHMSYDRFGGRELLGDLKGLCQKCHREVHRLHRKSGRQDLLRVTLSYIAQKKLGR